MTIVGTAVQEPKTENLHKKLGSQKLKRKFRSIHKIIAHVKMPVEKGGYIRSKRHEYY